MYVIFVLCHAQVARNPVHIIMLHNASHCIATASTLVEMQRNARIDSDPTLAFLCIIAFLCQKMFAFHKISAMQDLKSYCELAIGYRMHTYMYALIA